MPADFKWSPEAIDYVYRWVFSPAVSSATGPYGRDRIKACLDAAVKAQPVVALPPCPTCKGDRSCACGGEDSDGRGDVLRCHIHRIGCEDCSGSGVEQMVPVSEIRAWLRANEGKFRDVTGYYDDDLRYDMLAWLDERGRA